MIYIEEIKKFIKNDKVKWTEHCSLRMFERNIHRCDIINCINTGNIIEQYMSDYPYPSCLILGLSINNKKMHVVCGISENIVYVITAYYPETEKWDNYISRRKK